MKTHELRIGNLIEYKGKEFIVVEIRKNTLRIKHWSGITNVVSISDCNSIELTEEWLIKFGFLKNGFNEKVKSINPFERGIKELVFESDYLWIRDCDENILKMNNHTLTTIWNKDLMKQFFVHQLQNLYFALTGEELKQIEI